MEEYANQNFEPSEQYQRVFKSNKLGITGTTVKYCEDYSVGKGEVPLVICKYMSYSNLKKALDNDSFRFSSPNSWMDPFELLFYKPSMIVGREKVTIHGCCFTCNDIENEDGFWNIWGKNSSERIVRVIYNVDKLLEALVRQNEGNYEFYLGGMRYFSREYIWDKAHGNHRISDYDNINDCLNDLCLKQNAYKHENELRLFVKKKYNSEGKDNTEINNIKYNNGIIEEITLQPSDSLGNSHVCWKKINRIQDITNKQIMKELQGYIKKDKLTCRINQSALYCNSKERVY